MPFLHPKIPSKHILELLPDSIDSFGILGIEELNPSVHCKLSRKRFYRLKLKNERDLHLSYGRELGDLFLKSKSFNKALPNHSCRPVFIVNDGNSQLFGQEFFEGESLEDRLARSGKSNGDISDVLMEVMNVLDSIEQVSTSENMLKEIDNLHSQTMNNQFLSKLDIQILDNFVFPFMKKTFLDFKPTLRWSSGDLIARNILINDQNEFKIIDLEFAMETHFHSEDWIRLYRYSSADFKRLDIVKKKFEDSHSVIDIYSRVRQISLNNLIYPSDSYVIYAAQDIAESILVLYQSADSQSLSSLALKGFSSIFEKERILAETVNAKLVREKFHRKSAESDLVREKSIRLDVENELKNTESLRSLVHSELEKEKSLSNCLKTELEKEKSLSHSLKSDLKTEKSLSHSLKTELKTEKLNLTSAQSELSSERSANVAIHSDLILALDKVARMESSFSWKFTSPIRFLRRQKDKIVFFPFFKKRKTKITSKKLQDFYLPNIRLPRSPFEFDEKHSPRKMAYSSRKKGEAMRIDWLIPDFGIGSGGHTTIFRTILWLEKFGHQNKIWICGGTHHGDAKKALSIIHRHFFSIEADLDILLDPLDFKADSDAIVCTSYDTCYYGRAINFGGEKFYFVQDFEPEFSPIGSYYYLAEDTYRFGLNCITAGFWLAEKVKSVGGKVVGSFELAIDKSIFFRSQSERSKGSFQIAVYARCGTPRRLTELSIFALNLLSKKGLQFQVHFFGDSSLPFYADFPHQIHGVLSPHQLGSLYRRCTVGCVFSATNYSLVPLEMMACGLPVIEFDGANTRRTFPDNTVSFAKPSPESIADEIEKILCNENQRDIQIECALKYVSELSWEKSAKKVETAFLNTIDMKIPDLKIN